MLHLKKLELFGYKSFSDRQELRFNGDGIAAIVGPNGCGKSNVSDAISWVLGEQSAKTLRGANMQDFIFNGSRDRKPSGLAQVTITMVDPGGIEPSAHAADSPNGPRTNGYGANGSGLNGSGVNGSSANGSSASSGSSNGAPQGPTEIVVSRKLYRSGESQYLLNGKICRLRDVQDLFRGTGLGPQHYAIIEQGRIDQILRSRPLDRRVFIEEAAGVTMFKSRKRLAELKLQSARENLNRVNDILQEVTRQVNSLKRQASKARHYEVLKGELDEKLSLLLASRYRDMDQRLKASEQAMSAADGICAERLSRLQECETELASLRQQEQQSGRTLQQRRDELSEIALHSERLRSRIDQQARKAEDNQTRSEQAEAEIAHLDEGLKQLQEELVAAKATAEQADEKTGQVRASLRDKTAGVESAQTSVRENEQVRERQRAEGLRRLDEISGLRNQLAKIEEFLAGNERQASRLREEETACRQELAELLIRKAGLERDLENRQEQLDRLAGRKGQIELEISANKQEAQTRRVETEKLQEELSRLRARRDSLDEILSHHAYTTETVKNLFSAVERQPQEGFQPIGILADYVDVDKEHEKATEDFLREELEYVVVNTWSEAQEGVELLRRDVQGHATFLVHPESPVQADIPALGPETGVVGRLADFIRLTNGLSGSASTLLPRLRGCYLVREDTAARRLAIQYPDLHFLMPDGRCFRGYTLSGGRKSMAGPLALKRELRELRPRVEDSERMLARAVEATATADAEVARKTAELEAITAEFQEAEKSALASDHNLRQTQEQAQRTEGRHTVAQAELERVQKDTDAASARRGEHESKIGEMEARRIEADGDMTSLGEHIQRGQSELAKLREEQAEFRTELAILEERHRAAEHALERIVLRVTEHQERRNQIAAQAVRWETERKQLLANNVELEKEAEQHQGRREQARREADEIAQSLEQFRARIETLEGEIQSGRLSLEEARQRKSAIELKLVELRSDIKHLEETCQRELQRSIQLVLEGQPSEVTAEQLAEAETNYHALKAKLDNLGPVNVLALEEYKEAKQRHDFLETQQDDLLTSISDTQKAIAEIDLVSRRKFQEAFEAINNHFRSVFQTLFGGGVAEMRLIEDENAAESGIDIIASPPGKRLQNIALLSGGEKSLTAIALLMATFRYRPSPFCVLDEVDAPLDESNLVRFSRLITQMSETTQFILITHSKTTMEIAQTLYGVTMQQPGVSRLVSVRMPAQQNGSAARQPTLSMS